MTDFNTVERMRKAVARLLAPQMMPGQIYLSDEESPEFFPSPRYIESTLQTYITAGVNVIELEAKADEREAEYAKRCAEYMERQEKK